MALSGTSLGDAVALAVKTASLDPLVDTGAITEKDSDKVYASVKSSWETIGAALVSYLTANTVVTIPLGIPVSTAGSAAAQTGATTEAGIGTIS